MDDASLVADYQAKSVDCLRLLEELRRQIDHSIADASITLGTPIEGRVKSLQSILEKQERKEHPINSVTDFKDLVGLRIILLFHRDILKVDTLVQELFDVVERTDAADRLDAAQFGYQSLHYVLKVKDDWLRIPTIRDLGPFVFELQLRTLAQHIWAVASHKLQYKREISVPVPIRRAINRVSALLEMVDIEFGRVLLERERYVDDLELNHALPDLEPSASGQADNAPALDVDVLAAILDLLLPQKNKDEEGEPYDQLLAELAAAGITTADKLIDLISETRDSVEKDEARRAAEDPMDDPDASWERTLERYYRGVYFTHAGLIRTAMDTRYGAESARAIRRTVRQQF